MRFRTQLAAVAAVAMLGGLAACGGGDDSDTASPAAPGTSTAENPIGGSASEPSPSPGHGAGHSAESMITMGDNVFSPANLTVAPGTEVMVMNEGGATHNLKDEKTEGDVFDSGDVFAGKDATITAPDKAGSYPYVCTYHFGMKGTLTVK